MKGRDKLVTPRDEFFLLKILTSRKMAVTTHDSPSQRLQNQTLWIDLKKNELWDSWCCPEPVTQIYWEKHVPSSKGI